MENRGIDKGAGDRLRPFRFWLNLHVSMLPALSLTDLNVLTGQRSLVISCRLALQRVFDRIYRGQDVRAGRCFRLLLAESATS
jgi:hypothetical protein